MSEFTYKDYLPLNARIIIDYNQKKGEKVKFSFPNEMGYKKAVWHRAFPTVMSLCFVIFFLYLLLPIVILDVVSSVIMDFLSVKMSTNIYSTFFIDNISGFLILMFLIFPAVLTFYLSRDREKLSKWIPKFGYWTGYLVGYLCQKEFTDKDVCENKVVIPVFQNVTLRWFPNEDFNRYLEKIEILELPFSFKKKPFLMFGKWREIKNEYIFRAVFYFSQTPEKGSMLVEFI